jgi:hypothetical protein
MSESILPPVVQRASCERRIAADNDDGGGFLDVRAADLEEELAEQRRSVPPAPKKTAATQ